MAEHFFVDETFFRKGRHIHNESHGCARWHVNETYRKRKMQMNKIENERVVLELSLVPHTGFL